ncbi:uncharacterized protein TEOVI_000512500 [Trypanosoma equiperdum]|uniref:EGF-like domain-containing protein n=2 Tax=Trypanozoon TaxID=39700 RepID=Q382Y5_TRYB2|nr:hypothetical protein, conserved [Trypanosoma brucei brucei TREU927]EAN80146.1 hypothetical protein, conserved [Trypanosoma brucei brucei TREU927]SCU65774.1 hypothetical protein, conserved [Trypanosoma equiperdum]
MMIWLQRKVFLLGLFCVLVGMIACVNGHANASCPESCDTAGRWCEIRFNRGGRVSVGECNASSFTCVCNDAVDITVTRNEESCWWSGSFDMTNNVSEESLCSADTAQCPQTCQQAGEQITRCAGSVLCTEDGDGYIFTCAISEGTILHINKSVYGCLTTIVEPELHCNPKVTCSGHGYCVNPHTLSNSCVCFSDPINGYWVGANCSECHADYGPGGGNCTQRTSTIRIILSSIGSTWAMVLPNMVVLFLFVVLGLMRRESESDRSFQSTVLRKTGLSAVQVARRNRCGLFNPKLIPPRPPQSRCFLNEGEGRAKRRGPPAY